MHQCFYLLFCMVLCFNASCFAANTPAAPPTQPMQPLMGGYSIAKIADKDVQDAANFAVASINQGALLKILSAQVQVVAGKNYALQLVVAQNGVNYQYNVIVFVPLPNTNQSMQLTNVQAMGEYTDTSTAAQSNQ